MPRPPPGREGSRMKFFMFHLMPYRDLPDDFEEHHDSAWVWVPNELYDPETGAGYYREYLDQLAYAEELGFDGGCVNEHRQNAYGLMPSPNLIAAALTQRTSRVRIAIVGNALPLYDPPTRVAEEIAMLDLMSGGRIIAGQVIGGGPEYYSFSINPAEARTRFSEAHEIIMRAWTQPGPFEFYGEHYKLRYVNTWPRPLQNAPAGVDPRRGLAGDDGVRRPPPLRVHGHPVLPHRLLQEDLRAVQAGVREAGLRGAPRADGPADADLHRRDRRAGAPRVRGAFLVLQ